MGQGAVRSQMDTRICFRVRERRDVDLVLGQGMLTAGWHAHTLDAPGKFLVSAPEYATPKRARAYLVTDNDVARVTAYYGPRRPRLDDVSRAAPGPGLAGADPVPWYRKSSPRVPDAPAGAPASDDSNSLESVLWDALRSVPEDGADVAQLMQMTGLGRTAIYKYLSLLAGQGRAVRVGWGRWLAAGPGEEGDDE
jgi:S-DNA-T family DNA segregation ATPase FtsK/SpoIIIE